MTKVKNLIVCGDSFNALSNNTKFAGTHWSEHLSKQLKTNLINLASAGCSNRMIVMQIEEAMKYDDSLIMIAPAAHHARIELLTKSDQFLNENVSLESFLYNPPQKKTKNTFIRSVNASVFDEDITISSEVKKVLLENIPFGFYWHIDKWALYYALHQLKKKQKNFLFVETVVNPAFQILSYLELNELIGKEHIIANKEFRYQFYVNKITDTTFEDPGYHTTPVCQEITAHILRKIIIDRSAMGD